MTRGRTLVICVVMVGVGVLLGFWLSNEIMIDRCLDRGGAWNHQHAMCDAQ